MVLIRKSPRRQTQYHHNGITPVGNYAVRLTFSDGHDTGLFTWEILYRYGREQDQMMQDYLARLEPWASAAKAEAATGNTLGDTFQR